jgi:hypothetical protein
VTVNCSSQSRCHHLFEAFYGGTEPELSLLNVGSTIRTLLGDSFTRERFTERAAITAWCAEIWQLRMCEDVIVCVQKQPDRPRSR